MKEALPDLTDRRRSAANDSTRTSGIPCSLPLPQIPNDREMTPEAAMIVHSCPRQLRKRQDQTGQPDSEQDRVRPTDGRSSRPAARRCQTAAGMKMKFRTL
jgi:hypothetical protein